MSANSRFESQTRDTLADRQNASQRAMNSGMLMDMETGGLIPYRQGDISTSQKMMFRGIKPPMSAGVDRDRLRELLQEKSRSQRDVSIAAGLGETAVKDILNYTQEYEYKTLVILGAPNFDRELNDHAARGWELVNGCMAGTMHYGYLRRRFTP